MLDAQVEEMKITGQALADMESKALDAALSPPSDNDSQEAAA